MASRESVVLAIGADVYEVEKATTRGVTLVHRVTNERRTLTHHELANLLPPDAGPSPRLFDTLPRHVIEAVSALAVDIDEVLTGIGRNGRHRPEYDLSSTTQEQRIVRKLNELADAGRGMSRATFFDKLGKYRRDGLIGLVDGRTLREFPALQFVDPRVLTALIEVINDQKDRSTGTVSRIIEETVAVVRATYGPVPLPSRSSFYSLVKQLGAGKHSTGSAKTRRSLGNRPDRTFGKQTPLFPGAQVQVDTNTMDVEVRTPDGQRVRPRLSIMTDVHTRSIIAFTIRLKATKGIDHALLLAQAATPRPARPSREWFRETLRRQHPTISLMEQDAYESYAHAVPFIFPRSITTDRGNDYLSMTFRAAADKLQCSIVLAPPHTPTGKSHVERQFASVNSLFTQHLVGYVGRSAEHRGVDVPTEKLLTVEALRELFEDWVVRDWQNRPHSGLRDPLYPARLLSPNQMAERAAMTASQFRVPITRDDYIRMLDTEFRKIGSTGIRVGNREYDSEKLHPLRGTKSGHPRHNGKWPVKVDPYNPSCVWVVGPDHELIECHERGAENRLYEPDFPVLEDDYRALTAQSDAEITGTPMPQPTPIVIPEYTADESDIDDDYATPDF